MAYYEDRYKFFRSLNEDPEHNANNWEAEVNDQLDALWHDLDTHGSLQKTYTVDGEEVDGQFYGLLKVIKNRYPKPTE